MEVARAIGYEPPILCSSCEHGIIFQKAINAYACTVKEMAVSTSITKCPYYSGPQQPIDVVIVTATDIETAAVLKYLCPKGKEAWTDCRFRDDATIWSITELMSPKDECQKLRIALAQTDFMGLSATAVQAMQGVNAFKPKYLVMLGITAGKEGGHEAR